MEEETKVAVGEVAMETTLGGGMKGAGSNLVR